MATIAKNIAYMFSEKSGNFKFMIEWQYRLSFHTLYIQSAKALMRLHKCTGSSEHSLAANVYTVSKGSDETIHEKHLLAANIYSQQRL